MGAPCHRAPRTAARELFGHLSPGTAQPLGCFAAVPLFDDDAGRLPDAPAVDLLADALARGDARVTEVDLAGRVERLRVEHLGTRALLALDGEHVVGGKQDRIIDASTLLPARSALDLAVSCVERGRWSARDDGQLGFDSAGATLHPSARSDKLRRVVSRVRERQRARADQGEVWRSVEEHLTRTGARSATRALGASHSARFAVAGDAAVHAQNGQVGLALVDQDGRVSLDILGSPALFERALPLLARGACAEATGHAPTRWAASAVLTALERLEALHAQDEPVAHGEAWVAGGPGAALRVVSLEGRVVHAVATVW